MTKSCQMQCCLFWLKMDTYIYMGEAKGFFIAWPKSWIVTSSESVSKIFSSLKIEYSLNLFYIDDMLHDFRKVKRIL